jgi:chemotaxis signal transduction protein
MSEALVQLGGRAAQLRREFDLTFARAAVAENEIRERLLAIRMNKEHMALRMGDITGLFAGKTITPVPGAGGGGGMLGLASFRGATRPVFDLQYLVSRVPGTAPRFLVVAAAAPVAFGFEAFDGQIAATASGIGPLQGRPHAFANEFVKAGDVVRPIIHLPAVIEAIRRDRRRAS